MIAGSDYPFPLGGHPNGRYRQALTQTPGSTTYTSCTADLGALASLSLAQANYVAAPQPDPIEDAGIRAGEIVAYRCWELRDGLLRSMYADFTWLPRAIEQAHKVDEHWGTGLHAFKTLERARNEYRWADVYGEVALWGDVIEHEHGYRAEFAAVRKIIKVTPDIPILHLRRRILQKRYALPPSDLGTP
jgi:hypothetical protein